jgi:predicted  nucleic acid-binding Zn-ribbon protein
MRKNTRAPDRYHQRQCPKCGHWNGNSAIFCQAMGCGATIFPVDDETAEKRVRERRAEEIADRVIRLTGDVNEAVRVLKMAIRECRAARMSGRG